MQQIWWALIDAEVFYTNDDGVSDWSDVSEGTVAGDTLAPAAPSISATTSTNAIKLTLTPPSTNSDDSTCTDFKEYGIYYSSSASIDITNDATYDGMYTLAGSKTNTSSTTHPASDTMYFVAAAFDTFGNRSSASSEVSATPTAAETILENLVPNPFFEIDSNGDAVPDEWTLDSGWTRDSSNSYKGAYSIKGQGSDINATSDKMTLPFSVDDLLVSGVAKTSGTSFSIAETTNASLSSAPDTFVDVGGTIAAISRQVDSYDTIELWDVSTPASPSLLGTIDESGDTEHRSKPFKIYGDYLICGCQSTNHLYIYDISDPTSPTEIEDYSLANAEGRLAALAVRNWVVYACCDDDTNGGFIETIDISTPINATLLGTLASVIHSEGGFNSAHAVEDVLYVSFDSDGAWLTPTGHTDPDSGWNNEANAYDGNTATYAESDTVTMNDWTDFIYLTFPAGTKADSARYYADAGGSAEEIDIDAYVDSSWVDVYSGSFDDLAWETKEFSEGVTTQVRVRLKVAISPDGEADLYSLALGTTARIKSVDISTPASPSLLGTYYGAGQDSIGHFAIQGDYAYCACDAGTDQGKIVVLDISTPSSISESTVVGGTGSPNYTGYDALFLSNGYLVNVGDGNTSSQYAVSYWDISTPATPSRTAVSGTITGDMDAADVAGGVIVGVDVDNSKLRVVDPQTAADWELQIKFYDAQNNLLDTIKAYDGVSYSPPTGESWTEFSRTIPESDIPDNATQIEFVCNCDETTGYVYVDNLSAKFS